MGEGDGSEVKGLVEACGIKEEGVDIRVRKLIDEDSEAKVAAVVQKVLKKGRFSTAKKACNEGAAHAAAAKAGPRVEHPVLERLRHFIPFHSVIHQHTAITCEPSFSLCSECTSKLEIFNIKR